MLANKAAKTQNKLNLLNNNSLLIIKLILYCRTAFYDSLTTALISHSVKHNTDIKSGPRSIIICRFFA
jgi:hypothetical protein